MEWLAVLGSRFASLLASGGGSFRLTGLARSRKDDADRAISAERLQ
jgi:hypothetical protein